MNGLRDSLPFAVIMVGALLILLALLRARTAAAPQIERRQLLTKAELRFWAVLRSAFPEHCIAPQVAMGALLKPCGGQSFKETLATRGRFSQKIVDFAIVDVATGEVLAIVELDDRSHNVDKDAARDALLALGGYRVFRFSNKPFPTRASVLDSMASIATAPVTSSPPVARASL